MKNRQSWVFGDDVAEVTVAGNAQRQGNQVGKKGTKPILAMTKKNLRKEHVTSAETSFLGHGAQERNDSTKSSS